METRILGTQGEYTFYSVTIGLQDITAILESFTSDENERIQIVQPIEYTQRLADLRFAFEYERLSSLIRSQFGPLVADKGVLEIGPGIEDILYEMLFPPTDTTCRDWTAFDINDKVVEALERKYSEEPNFRVLQGTACSFPFTGDYFDVVIGCNVLDSVISYDQIGKEIMRVLKEGGVFIHLQDFLPSRDSLFTLLFDDPQVRSSSKVTLYGVIIEGELFNTHVQIGNNNLVRITHYLQKGIEREFKKLGFLPSSKGIRTFSANPDYAGIVSEYLNKTQMLHLPIRAQYSYVVMGKN